MNRIIIILVLVFLLVSIVEGQEMRKWRNANDKWTGMDKAGHFVGSATLYMGLRSIGINDIDSVALTVIGGIIWEVKDALIPYEKVGWWGGDGFSWRDIVWDIGGVLFIKGLIWVMEVI